MSSTLPLSSDAVASMEADPLSTGKKQDDWTHGLKSNWPVALDLYGSNLPCRLEGEVEDLVSSTISDTKLQALDPTANSYLYSITGCPGRNSKTDQRHILPYYD